MMMIIMICGRVRWVCVEPVKDTVVHSAGPTLPLMEKTLKPARELFFGGHCLHCLMDIVHPLMDIVQPLIKIVHRLEEKV